MVVYRSLLLWAGIGPVLIKWGGFGIPHEIRSKAPAMQGGKAVGVGCAQSQAEEKKLRCRTILQRCSCCCLRLLRDRSFQVVVVFLASRIARERVVLELSYPQQRRSFYKL